MHSPNYNHRPASVILRHGKSFVIELGRKLKRRGDGFCVRASTPPVSALLEDGNNQQANAALAHHPGIPSQCGQRIVQVIKHFVKNHRVISPVRLPRLRIGADKVSSTPCGAGLIDGDTGGINAGVLAVDELPQQAVAAANIQHGIEVPQQSTYQQVTAAMGNIVCALKCAVSIVLVPINRGSHKVVLYLIGATFAIGVSTINAAVYYVRTDGNNGNDGLSNTAGGAKANLSGAVAVTVAGDVVRVQPGTYSDRGVETSDGTITSPIVFLADGVVQIRGGFHMNGSDYVKVIGFDITHSNNPGGFAYEAVRTENARGVEIIDCHVHHTDAESITFRNSPDGVVRGCEVHYSQQQDYPWPVNQGRSLIWCGGTASTNLIVEYCWLYDSDDILSGTLNSNWRYMVLRNCRIGPIPADTGAHHDNIQPNAVWQDILFESNWDEGCNAGIIDIEGSHHQYYFEVAGQRRVINRGNVMVNSIGYANHGGVDFVSVYNNTYHSNRLFAANSRIVDFNDTQGGASVSNVVYNSLFTWASTDTPVNVQGTAQCVFDYNLSIGQAAMAQGTHNLTSDPTYVSRSAPFDVRLQGGSPAIDAGWGVSFATSGESSSTTLGVTRAEAFWPGDVISFSGTTATVVTVDSTTQLTITPARTWTNNSPIFWATLSGTARNDLGALESAVTPFGTATYQVSGNNYTVTVNFEWRFFNWYSNGIPIKVDYPTTTFSSDAAQTIRAYPLLATTNRYATATATGVLATGNTTVTVSGPGKSFAKPVYGN